MNHMQKPGFSWTEENVTLLITLNDQGHSKSAIGRLLGTNKNSVIGKLNRLGMCHPENNPITKILKADRALFTTLWKAGKSLDEIVRRTGVVSESAVKARARAWRLPMRKAVEEKRERRTVGVRTAPKPRDIRNDPLVEYEAHDGPGCKWLHGEPVDFYYCGAPTLSGTDWCEHHHARVYQPRRKKEDKQEAA